MTKKERPVPDQTKQAEDPVPSNDPAVSDRRQLLKKLAMGSAVITGQQVLPSEWSKPLVNSVIIPAHAQLSPPSGGSPAGDRGALADDFPDVGPAADGDPANDTDFTLPQDGADSGVDGSGVDSDTDRDGDQDEQAGDGTDVF